MPELPEVETVKNGLLPHIQQQVIDKVIIRQHQLRWSIEAHLTKTLPGECFNTLTRRAKYLLFRTQKGTLIVHLGMSGCLRLVQHDTPLVPHDHVDIIFKNKHILRYHDPRRFGAILWTTKDPHQHQLLQNLGPEPLSDDFNAGYLHQKTKHHKQAIKTFLMNGHIVVGVGNIYANEILFQSQISPLKPANTLTQKQAASITKNTKLILQKAIAQGGTTLKDFYNSEGKPGYFQQTLRVYGRGGLPCFHCRTPLVTIKQLQRPTTYCPLCQC